MKSSEIVLIVVFGSTAVIVFTCCGLPMLVGILSPPTPIVQPRPVAPVSPDAEPASGPGRPSELAVRGAGQAEAEINLEDHLQNPDWLLETVRYRQGERIDGAPSWIVTGKVVDTTSGQREWTVVFIEDVDSVHGLKQLYVGLDFEDVAGDEQYLMVALGLADEPNQEDDPSR